MTDVGQDLHVGRVLDQRYRLVSPVGSGASARVYLAEDLTLRRRVAVKLLHNGLANDATFRKRFRAEAHSAAQLSHPNIMAVYDWSETTEEADAPAYLVTELLTGGSLRTMLDAGHRLSLSQALIVGLHAAEGLAYAHYNGFVHRDIKPANLLFGAEGRLRLADFGIARAVAEASWTEPEGALVGTARYAAPEQASGSGVDGRADVYALAVTIVEAVTGSAPLTGPTPLATMVLRQETDLTVPDELGPLVDGLRAAGKANADERSTAEELAFALRQAASELPRPKKLPLTGLPADPRGQETTAEAPPSEAETGVLVLGDETVAGPAIDLSTTAPRPAAGPELPTTELASIDDVELGSPLVPDLEIDDDELVDQDGLVVEEDHRRQWPIIALLLLLGVGAFVAYQSRDSADLQQEGDEAGSAVTHIMPTLVGRSFDEAVADIERNNWTYVVTEGRDDDAEVGDVLEQSPQPGTEWTEGSEVTLVISEGATLRDVPTLVGLQLEVALAELADAGLFLGSTGEAYDEEVPDGQVMSASLEAGNQVEVGSAVDLVWSLGPAPREIPDLTGRSAEDAAAELEALQLVVLFGEEFSEDVPEGEVIRTEPAQAASVARDTEVTVVVSQGLPFIEVPDVSGMSAAEAADILAGAGFVVTDTVGPPNGEVLATDPPAGEFHRKGSSVVIFVRSS